MLQVDPKKRPRVEDLEVLPAIQSEMLNAKLILGEFRLQQVNI